MGRHRFIKGKKRSKRKSLAALSLSSHLHWNCQNEYISHSRGKVLTGECEMLFYQVSPHSGKHLRKFAVLPSFCPYHIIPRAVKALHNIWHLGLVGQNDPCATKCLILQILPFQLHTATLWGTNLCKDVFCILLLYKAAWWRSTSLAVSSNLSLILFCSRIGLKRICRAAKQFISLPYPWWLVANSCNLWWKFSTAPFHISWTRDLLQEVFISGVFDLHLVLLCLENRVGHGKDMIKNGKDVVIWSDMTGAQQRLIQS